MGYIEELRKVVGTRPLILVRPSVVIRNAAGEILLVQYRDNTWGIPGGLMELGESAEDCARREIREELGLELKNLSLFGVFSGKELYTKLRNGDEYYNVVIGYICTEYEGELKPDGVEVREAGFYKTTHLPEGTNPLVKSRIGELGNYVKRFVAP
ncbi:NUDIX domain-containing protein [Paenibacillus mesophilus]|uniref:NUDIX hydrolase n=1 Tax=Paenibacillus mesophilus TaxID=2582849 RepID=UPI00110EA6B6|nr:NUDIX domain-containing protein [Paenibacillus mesophilus]TMV46133.1 NUDIX domain-containing protein [Paenibacillus mesophilus]